MELQTWQRQTGLGKMEQASPTSIRAVDLNGDGIVDLVAIGCGFDAALVLIAGE